MGATSGAPMVFGDGLRCVGGPVFRSPAQNSGPAGAISYGPGLVAYTLSTFPPAGHIQGWYRDPGGPCGANFKISNMLSATFGP